MSSVTLAEIPALKPLVSTATIAELAGVAPNTVLEWSKQGKLPKPIRLGKRTIRWHRADVLALLNGTYQAQASGTTEASACPA
jgi:predicted DNA-binding transcriptional regulator AlpA